MIKAGSGLILWIYIVRLLITIVVATFLLFYGFEIDINLGIKKQFLTTRI